MGLEQERPIGPELYLNHLSQARELAEKFNIPLSDVLLTGLNLSGIRYNSVLNDRGRFWIEMPDGKGYRVALTITTPEFTNFTHSDGRVLLGNIEIVKASTIEKDTCTDSYWRGPSHITLNTNQRSLCKGCGFCGTYNLEVGDTPLTDEVSLVKEAEKLSSESGGFENVKSIGIVTGCFMNEETLVKHIKLVRKVFSRNGFKGEIQYVGSQIKTEQSILKLANDGPFSLYLTIEVFSNREGLMKKQKAFLTLGRARELLEYAKNSGAGSSFLYIAGLDSLDTYFEELPKFEKAINRFPQIQTYQLYVPKQIVFRHKDAYSLDYFFKIRQFTELVLPNFVPVIHHNYRGLWYNSYSGRPL